MFLFFITASKFGWLSTINTDCYVYGFASQPGSCTLGGRLVSALLHLSLVLLVQWLHGHVLMINLGADESEGNLGYLLRS